MQKEDYLNCLICIELSQEAVESKCCNSIFCNECARSIRNNVCPKCRATPFEFKESILARRMIDSTPYQCPNCKEKTTMGEMKSHSYSCSEAVRKCKVENCNYEAPTDEFFVHLITSHKKELLTSFDQTVKPLSNSVSAPSNGDPIGEKTNMNNKRKAKLGSSGKYYCGGKLEGPCGAFSCCDGSCGPTNGCNCRGCMLLDIQTRKLPKGYYVNRDGAACRKGTTDKMYCGRKMNLAGSDGYCGPNNGPQCGPCKILDLQLDTRYQRINQ